MRCARSQIPNRFHLAVSLLFLLLLMMMLLFLVFSSHLFCYYYYFVDVVFSFSSLSFFFWFDFVECEIIIKIVGVYFVCSELYNLHELLGKRFCTHTHTHAHTIDACPKCWCRHRWRTSNVLMCLSISCAERFLLSVWVCAAWKMIWD